MVEFILGYFLGIAVMCMFQITKEVEHEEKKTSNKEKKHRKD